MNSESSIHRIICERLIARALRYCFIPFIENETEWNEIELVTFIDACCIYIRMYIWHVKCSLHSTVYIRRMVQCMVPYTRTHAVHTNCMFHTQFGTLHLTDTVVYDLNHFLFSLSGRSSVRTAAEWCGSR